MGLQNAGVAALAYDAGGPLQPQLVPQQGHTMLMMLAAWGWRSPGVAEFTADAGGLLQPQLVSPARASDAGRVGLEKRWGGCL